MPPEAHIAAVPTLFSLGLRPHIMTGFFREWLTFHFSAATYIEHPELRGLLWSQTMSQAKLQIESITRYKPQATEQRPSIIIRREDWSTLRLGIDNRMQGGFDLTGADHFAILLQGAHTLFCLSRNAQEAELLASEVSREFLQFGEVIRQQLGLVRFEVAGTGKLGELEEARENYAAPVTVGYVVEEKWKVFLSAPVLKRLVLSAFLP